MNWTEFLQQAESANAAKIIVATGSHSVAIDDRLPEAVNGLSLNKKGADNPKGEPFPSVLALINALSKTDLYQINTGAENFEAFCDHLQVFVSDASPDTVISFLSLAALNLGAAPPDAFWQRWLGPIRRWELSGNAQNPEGSWPALASALAHRHYATIRSHGPSLKEQISAAWNSVVPFAIEAIQAEYDLENIPENETGRWLAIARSALAEERARYQRKAYASEMWQLSVPMRGTPRRKLVDALFSQEAELTGVMKSIARNDTDGSPLGAGFSALVIERPELRESAPDSWITISLDERTGTHLEDLWIELESRETEAWQKAGFTRPIFVAGKSREIASIDAFGRVYHEPWYIDQSLTLIGSPKPQIDDRDLQLPFKGSLLTRDQVRDAIFATFDPLQDFQVFDHQPQAGLDQETLCLTKVYQETGVNGRKRVFTAWTPPDAPLPHPAGPAAPLPDIALRVMAARTMGIESERALRDAPDLEDLETVSFGNGLGVLTDSGVFLLDCGRRVPSAIAGARKVAEQQCRLADELDRIQRELIRSADRLNEDAQARVSSREAISRQRALAALNVRVVRARTTLDKPLETDEAGLRPLKEALSKRWNVGGRLQELSEDIAALDASSRSAEALRAYWVGRLAAAGGIGILCGDALVAPVSQALDWENDLAGHEQILIFVIIFAATAAGAWLLFEWLRSRLRRH